VNPEPSRPGPPPRAAELLRLARDFLRDLFDLRFSKPIAVRMLPGVYGLGIAVSALFTGYVVVNALRDSLLEGLAWLLLLGPAMFIGLVTALRMLLEFALAVFRMAWYVEHVAGHTEEMRKDMPKFGWWRTLLFGQSGPPPPGPDDRR
jgi:hypothetical protein